MLLSQPRGPWGRGAVQLPPMAAAEPSITNGVAPKDMSQTLLQHLNFGPASRGPKLGHGSFGPRSFGPKLCAYKSVLLSSLDQRLSELCRDYVSIECRRGECRKSDRADGTV